MGKVDLSILLSCYPDEGNAEGILSAVQAFAKRHEIACDVSLLRHGSNPKRDDASGDGKPELSTNVIWRNSFGECFREGLKSAKGEWILTINTNGSHNPSYLHMLWKNRLDADMVIASRYVRGGFSNRSFPGALSGRILNWFLVSILDIPVRDITSGFFICRREALGEFDLSSKDYDVFVEAIVKTYAFGFKIAEVPFHATAPSHARSTWGKTRHAYNLLRSSFSLWRTRNTVYFADYDLRAYQSRLPPQRWWHRRRYKVTAAFMEEGLSTLEVGCGTGRMFFAHPDHIGLDMDIRKTRFLGQWKYQVVTGDASALPFPDGSFEQLICQEVVEHSTQTEEIFSEFSRVLKPGGVLVLSTPDYSPGSLWPPIEKIYARVMPNAYAEEHITRFTRESLRSVLEEHGFEVSASKNAFFSIMHVKALRK
jgi:dolichol-phosphate mannosyltransferase